MKWKNICIIIERVILLKSSQNFKSNLQYPVWKNVGFRKIWCIRFS